MLKENHDLKGALESYIVLLEEKEFFEAHEVLEEAWHPLRKANHPLKNLLKGLINGAISFEHLKRERNDAKRKAESVMKSFDRHKHLCMRGIVHYELFEKACSKIEDLRK